MSSIINPFDSLAILENLPLAAVVLDSSSRDVLLLNKKFHELFGYSEGQIQSEKDWGFLAFPDPRYRAHISREWDRRVRSARNFDCEVEPLEVLAQCADGSQRTVRVHLACRQGLSIITLVDITDLKELQGKLEQLASTDSLTGLANRRAFFSGMEQVLALCARHQRPVSIMLADIDHFKAVNDTYGHQAGDAALRHVAELIRSTLRTSDLAARVGGEEFAMLLPETDKAGAYRMADRLRVAIAENVYAHCAQPIPITVSFGLACLHGLDSSGVPSCDDFLRTADAALYDSKRQGRNRVSYQELRIP